jgi:RNA polymerase sigma factor (sigma-70 family)
LCRLNVGKNAGLAGHVRVVVSARRPDVRREDLFQAVYVEHYRSIYAYVHRRLAGTEAEVHDVVADVFAVVWRRLDDVPAAPEDRVWLYGVARRCVLRAQRSGRRRRRLQARLSDEARLRDSANGQNEDAPAVLVRAAIERLRPGDREVLRLVMWEGLSHAEAARVLDCSTNAVGLRLHKARARLRSELSTSGARPSDSMSDLDPRS